MCQYCLDARARHQVRGSLAPVQPALGRRSLLKLGIAAAASFAVAAKAGAKPAAKPDAKAVPKPENAISPDGALERLMQGNRRYVAGVGRRYDFKAERAALSRSQNPFAAILSCADSRIAPEFCFDTARGDVFVCRVAGNLATDEIVASLEYAVQVLNTPLIMVLGHDACGAVDAAIKSIKDGTTLPGHLPSLVDAIKPAVDAAKNDKGDMLANTIRRNAALNVDKLKNAAPILKAAVDTKKIRVVGGVYNLETGKVDLVG
jgi:carbonic anhydrase